MSNVYLKVSGGSGVALPGRRHDSGWLLTGTCGGLCCWLSGLVLRTPNRAGTGCRVHPAGGEWTTGCSGGAELHGATVVLHIGCGHGR